MNKTKFNKSSEIITTIFIMIFIIITAGVIFSQTLPEGYDDSSFDSLDTYENSDLNNYIFNELGNSDNNISFDSDIIAPLRKDETLFIPLRNPENFMLVSEIDVGDIEIEQQKISFNFLEDMVALDIKPEEEVVNEYVSPEEIGGNNFVFMAVHDKLEDKKGIRSYYEIYFDDKLKGTTNQGPWYGSQKIYMTKILIDKEYEVIVKLKESTVLGSQWLDALNKYQPNYKEYETQEEKDEKEREGELYPITINNQSEERVTYLFVVWSSESKRYAIGTGDFHKARHSEFWKSLQKFYSQQNQE